MTVEVRLCVVCGLSFTVGLQDIKVTYLCLQVMMVSALKNIGIEAVWETMQEYQTTVEVYMHYCILEVRITDYTGSVHAYTHNHCRACGCSQQGSWRQCAELSSDAGCGVT